MKTKIGIFNGKQAKNNKYLLLTLYNSGPLTGWELTKTVREKNLQSLYSIFNRRLRDLEKKGYVERAINSKWALKFKGIIACLLIQKEPKPWNEKWSMLFEKIVQPVINSPKSYSIIEDGKKICELKDFLEDGMVALKNFEVWEVLAKKLNELIEKGFMKNLDFISPEDLGVLIISRIVFDEEYFHDYTK
jgi:hypothetical protein